MAGGIFISYRRDDAKHAAGRLVDRLTKTYAPGQLFMDVDGIEPGLDFVKVLSDKVQACDVLLAVIGPGWLDTRDAGGQRRLDSTDDFVRIEIAAALERDVRVIPLLVDGARMPTADELPAPLKGLARRQATRLAHERFGADVEMLVGALVKVVAPRAGMKGWFAPGGGIAAPSIAGHNPAPQIKPAIVHRDAVAGPSMHSSTFATDWPPVAAWAFPLAAMGFTSLCIVQFAIHQLVIVPLGNLPGDRVTIYAVNGSLTGGLLSLGAALWLTKWRRPSAGGAELALYWLGAMWACAFAICVLVSHLGLEPKTSSLSLGLLNIGIAAGCIIISWWIWPVSRSHRTSGLEWGIYLLGSLAPILLIFAFSVGYIR